MIPRIPQSVSTVNTPKVRPTYHPIEIPLELPEPAPHNSHADSNESETPHMQHANGDAVMGIMRTSVQPVISLLTSTKQRQSSKTRPKRAGVAASQNDASMNAASPVALHAASNARLDQPIRSFASTASESPSYSTDLPYAHDLPAERDSGNIEYKWKLLGKTADRIVHLTTQMAYRLSEGSGQMLYELGVADSGYAQGLSPEDLDASIRTVQNMATTLQCELRVLVRARGQEGEVAEVLVRRIGEVTPTPAFVDASSSAATSASSGTPATPASSAPVHAGDLRIALIGQSAGKSSLLGCLVSNQRDDGRGRSRLHVFRHRHEIENGRTSAIARQIIGFDAAGNISNYSVHHKATLGATSATTSSSTHTVFTSPIAAPPIVQKKKEKGISSLFGDGASDSEGSDGEDSEDDTSDFGFDVASPRPETPMISIQTLAPTIPDALQSLALNGEEAKSFACSTHDWQRILEQSHKVYTFFDLPSDYTKTAVTASASGIRSSMSGLIGTSCPDYCCIVVSCASGLDSSQTATNGNATANANGTAPADAADGEEKHSSPPTPSVTHHHSLISSLTREQIMLCCALGIPFLLVLAKADLAVGQEHRDRLFKALKQVCAEAHVHAATQTATASLRANSTTIVTHKIPLLVRADSPVELDLLERNMSETLFDTDIPVSHRASIVRSASVGKKSAASTASSTAAALSPTQPTLAFPPHTFTPVFLLSNVTGEGFELFKRYLGKLVNYRQEYWKQKSLQPVEFSIDEIFSVDSVGSVVSGTLLSGVIHEGDTLLLGPISAPIDLGATQAEFAAACATQFRPVLIKSLHISRKCFRNAKAGQSVTLALKKVDRSVLRRGMVLLGVPKNVTLNPPAPLLTPAHPRACVGFEAFIRIFDPHQPSLHRAHPGSRSSASGLNKQWLLAQQNPVGVRYQPIVHVGNVRQSAEIVTLRMFSDAAAQDKIEHWIEQHCTEDADPSNMPDLQSLLDAPAAVSSASAPTPFTDQSRTLTPGSCALVRFEFLYQSEFLRIGRQVLFREERTRGTGVITRLYFVDEPSLGASATEQVLSPEPLVPSPSPVTNAADAPSTSPSPSPAPRSDSSSPDTAASPTNAAVNGVDPTSTPSPNHLPQRKIRKKSDPKITSSSTNVFQLAKERRRRQFRRMERVAAARVDAQRAAQASSPSQVILHPSSRSPLIQSLPSTDEVPACSLPPPQTATFAQSVPNTPALRAQPRPIHTNGNNATVTAVDPAQRLRAESDVRPSASLVHAASPPLKSYANGDLDSASPASGGLAPSHSISDSALSSHLQFDSFRLPDTSFPMGLSTLPLSRIISVDPDHPEYAEIGATTDAVGLVDPSDHSSSDENEGTMDDISDFFGNVKQQPKRKHTTPVPPEQRERTKPKPKAKRPAP